MKLYLALILMFLSSYKLLAQEKPQYAVSLIPDSLRKDVNSVIREKFDILIIRRPGKGKQLKRSIVTVLNEKADDELHFGDYYDKFRKIEDVEINLYDENGNYIKRIRKRDLKHSSYDDGSNLASDGKIISGYLNTGKYPVTIEISYEVNYEGFLDYEDFIPQIPNQSIQHAVYSITVDSSNNIRYKNNRCNLKPVIKQDGASLNYVWEIYNTKQLETEKGSAQRNLPRVMISPSHFEMDDYDGDMTTWNSFGKWQISLNNETNQLPEEKAIYYRNIVKDAATDREKVRILYRHLQENYRYVSIQLGIGGWKPFTAEFVEKKKYGDCKALSNFMYAMLKAVNIRSHFAIINSGTDLVEADKEFPQWTFNHVILCVPLPSDTIWLECTSRTQPFGKLSVSTENRYAFLITENGGILAATPRSKPEDNCIHTSSLIQLSEDGSGKSTVDISPSGTFADIINHYVFEADDQQKRSYLITYAGFKQPDILQISEKNGDKEKKVLHLEMEYEKIPDFTAGSKQFLSCRLYKFWEDALPKSENRKNDYYMNFPLLQSDSTIYQLPEGYIAENLPKAASITYELGSYQSTYSFDAAKRQLITTCRIKLDTHIIPAARYQEASKFFTDIIKEQQQKIVVRKE